MELTYAVEMGGTLHMDALSMMQTLGIEVDCVVDDILYGRLREYITKEL